MTTPAITALLDSHAELIESRALSFDQKVGYLTAKYERAISVSDAELDTAIYSLIPMIHAALQERQSARLKALAAKAPEPVKVGRAIAIPPRNNQPEIDRERQSMQLWASRLSDPMYVNALENLQLHLTRLMALERKVKHASESQS